MGSDSFVPDAFSEVSQSVDDACTGLALERLRPGRLAQAERRPDAQLPPVCGFPNRPEHLAEDCTGSPVRLLGVRHETDPSDDLFVAVADFLRPACYEVVSTDGEAVDLGPGEGCGIVVHE
jgi:hypothetical protein